MEKYISDEENKAADQKLRGHERIVAVIVVLLILLFFFCKGPGSLPW